LALLVGEALQWDIDYRDFPSSGVLWHEYQCVASRVVDVENDDWAFVSGRGELTETFGLQEAFKSRNLPYFIDKIVPLDTQFRITGGRILS
jgi:hypothetical protein